MLRPQARQTRSACSQLNHSSEVNRPTHKDCKYVRILHCSVQCDMILQSPMHRPMHSIYRRYYPTDTYNRIDTFASKIYYMVAHLYYIFCIALRGNHQKQLPTVPCCLHCRNYCCFVAAVDKGVHVHVLNATYFLRTISAFTLDSIQAFGLLLPFCPAGHGPSSGA